MGKITKIEPQKNIGRVNIFVDGAFFSGIDKETAIINNLFVGKEIDESKLIEISSQSEIKRAFEKACDYLGTRAHSEFEIKTKLAKKGFSKNSISGALIKLKEYNYIDDKIFAEEFVRQNSKYSKKMLEAKLIAKGVSGQIISEVLAELSGETEVELCKKIAEKYARGKDISSPENSKKLFASLARKGFSFDVIKKVVKNLSEDDF